MDELTLQMARLSALGYYCSQIILKLGLELEGRENTDLIRAMAGLAMGVGSGQGTCGCLTGGACLLALHAAKGRDAEPESEILPALLNDLWMWFEEMVGTQHGGVCCDQILADGTPRTQRCPAIVAETYSKVLEILTDYGIDPTESRA